MQHAYYIQGMHCQSCKEKIIPLLQSTPHITGVDIEVPQKKLMLTMDQHVDIDSLNKVLSPLQDYKLVPRESRPVSRFKTYRPLILIFIVIFLLTILDHLLYKHHRGWSSVMRFMAWRLLVFAFLKIISLRGFAASFPNYDPIAAKSNAYARTYPFIELLLGVAFLMNYYTFVASIVVVIVFSIGTWGIYQTLRKQGKFQCACIGTLFTLPLTKVTIRENCIMIAMSIAMIAYSILA